MEKYNHVLLSSLGHVLGNFAIDLLLDEEWYPETRLNLLQ